MFVSPLFFVQHTDEESDADSFQTQPWGLPVLQRGFTVSVHGLLSVNKKGMCRRVIWLYSKFSSTFWGTESDRTDT